MMKRRKFCGLLNLGAIVSCFPLVLAACTPSERVSLDKTEDFADNNVPEAPVFA